VPVAPSGEGSRGQAGAVDPIAVRYVWQQFHRLNPSVYSAALHGGGCSVIARFDVNQNKVDVLCCAVAYDNARFQNVC